MTTPDQTPPADAALQLPTDTTPTWEIELLISGALTFATLQLPGLLDGWFFSFEPKLPESLEGVAIMAYIFAKCIAVVLAITFSIHILLRGFWAAALGLHSVYPDGVRWNDIKMGPIFRRVLQDATPTMPSFIAKLDNVASVGFALGGLLLQLTIVSAVGTLIIFGICEGITHTTGVRVDALWVLAGIGVVYVAPLLIAGEFDRRLGGTLPSDSSRARWIGRVARGSAMISPTRLMGPMLLIFTSRLGQVRGIIALVLLIYAALGLVMVQLLVTLGIWSLDGYRFLPEDGNAVLNPRHYAESRKDADRYATQPFIPSEIVRGGTVRIFVPYRIDAYDVAVERGCPGAARDAATSDTLKAKALLDSAVACLGRQLAPTLDGTAIVPQRWFAASDPESGLRGLVTWIPVGGVSEGIHVLSLAQLPSRQRLENAGAKGVPPRRYDIPFWVERSGVSPER